MSFKFIYFIFDAAKLENNFNLAIRLNPKHKFLYRENNDKELEGVGPYLFEVDTNTPFPIWYFENGWALSWGIIIYSYSNFELVYNHFKNFLLVKTEEGEEFYFRFYDPRVLKIFLQTCDAQQVIEFFGPVESFIIECENKEEAIRYWHQNGALKHEVLSVKMILDKAIY